MSPPDPHRLAAQFAAGVESAEAGRWLRDGIAAWVRAGGTVELEQCLGLASTPRRFRLAQRNYWLCRAAQALEESGEWSGAWSGAVLLAAKLDDFIARGPWRAWREAGAPPAEASELREALFHAARLNEGESLSERSMFDISRSVLP